MIQSTVIEALVIQSKKEEWPYPKLFQALKEAGVILYTVKIADFDSVYHGSFGIWNEPVPEGFRKVAISTQFNKLSLVDALNRRMKKEITFVEFLNEVAAAGVDHYVVTMADRTVIYYGINADDFYTQHVPQMP